jgi:hypothetical protein
MDEENMIYQLEGDRNQQQKWKPAVLREEDGESGSDNFQSTLKDDPGKDLHMVQQDLWDAKENPILQNDPSLESLVTSGGFFKEQYN